MFINKLTCLPKAKKFITSFIFCHRSRADLWFIDLVLFFTFLDYANEYWARLFVCFLFLIILMFCMAGHENLKTSSFQNINIRQSFVIRGIESVQMHLFLIDVYIYSSSHFNLWPSLSMSFLSSFASKRYRPSLSATHSPSKFKGCAMIRYASITVFTLVKILSVEEFRVEYPA